jgi:hypothetical protein
MADEVNTSEVFQRLARLEQENHTAQYRLNVMEAHNLPIRVANLEPAVKNIAIDVSKIESSMGEMKDIMSAGIGNVKEDVSSMKSWGKGVALTLTSLVACIGLLLAIGEYFK